MKMAMFGSTGAGRAFPLDYDERGYSYIERPNAVLLSMLRKYTLDRPDTPRILDVGCGAGANARALRELRPDTCVIGIEPSARAAAAAREACDEVLVGTLEECEERLARESFDAVVLSDVLEHVVEPVRFLRTLLALPGCERARLFVSVPNYAVWYNRLRTLAGRFSYSWSGLYDRTHLRFFTRASIRELLEHCGLRVLEQTGTPSLVQSTAPLLRPWFEADVERGEHLTLPESRAFRVYSSWVEPLESRVCALWPELLAFQIVTVAER